MTNFSKKYVSLAVIAVLTICQACDSDKIGGTGNNAILIFRNASTSRPGGDFYLLKVDEGQPVLVFDTASGEAKLAPLDNRRYSRIRWTSVQEVLAEHPARAQTL